MSSQTLSNRQYAYNPPPTLENHVVAPGLSHEQQAPARMALVKRQMELLPQAHPQQHAPTVVPKFKPAGDVRHVPMHQDQRQPQRQPQANPDRMRMPPPPAPAPPPQMRVHGQQRQGVCSLLDLRWYTNLDGSLRRLHSLNGMLLKAEPRR